MGASPSGSPACSGPSRGNRRAGIMVTACLAWVALAGCVSAPESGWIGTIDTTGGSVVVHNPGVPAWPVGGIVLENACRSEPGALELPTSLAVIADAAYVLDESARRVLRLDPATCAPESTIATGGPGPGELLRPTGLLGFDGNVAVFDAGRRSLELFNANGDHLGARDLGATTFSVLPWGAGALAIQFRQDRLPVHLQPDGETEVVSLGHVVGAPPSGVVAECPLLAPSGTRLIAGCRERPAWFVLDTGRGKVRDVRVDRPIVSRSDSAIEAYVAAELAPITDLPDSTMRSMAEMLRRDAAVRRTFHRPVVDASLGLVVILDQEADLWRPEAGTLLWFTLDGRFVAETRTSGPWADFIIVGGQVWAIEEVPSGDRLVVRHTVRLQPELSKYVATSR